MKKRYCRHVDALSKLRQCDGFLAESRMELRHARRSIPPSTPRRRIRSAQGVTRVDHERVAARRLYKNPVALPDVDEGDAQIVPRRMRRPQHERTRRRDDREGGEFEAEHTSLSRQSAFQQCRPADITPATILGYQG